MSVPFLFMFIFLYIFLIFILAQNISTNFPDIPVLKVLHLLRATTITLNNCHLLIILYSAKKKKKKKVSHRRGKRKHDDNFFSPRVKLPFTNRFEICMKIANKTTSSMVLRITSKIPIKTGSNFNVSRSI